MLSVSEITLYITLIYSTKNERILYMKKSTNKKKDYKEIPVMTFGKIYYAEKNEPKFYDYVFHSVTTDDKKPEEIEHISLRIKHSIGAVRLSNICSTVAETVFDISENRYLPEITSTLIDMQILREYANFAIPTVFEKMYSFVTETGVAEFVKSKINQKELALIYEGVQKRIEYMQKKEISEKTYETALIMNQFKALTENISSIGDKVDLNKMMDMVNHIIKEEENKPSNSPLSLFPSAK